MKRIGYLNGYLNGIKDCCKMIAHIKLNHKEIDIDELITKKEFDMENLIKECKINNVDLVHRINNNENLKDLNL